MRWYLTLSLLSFMTYAASHHPEAFIQNLSQSKNQGYAIYQHFCANCHAEHPPISLGAPRKGVVKDWQQRLLQGLDILFQHTNEGYGAMPPRGGCFECSDEQLKLSIIYMIPKEAKKSFKNQR